MKYSVGILLLMTFLGCTTVNVPGTTLANNTLKGDIVRIINMIENAQAPNCGHKIINTKFIRQDGKDYYEEWIVSSCGKEIIYPVKLTPSMGGGTDFVVSTPSKR